jgi:peptidoglycan hydrolase CwlO-like protein
MNAKKYLIIIVLLAFVLTSFAGFVFAEDLESQCATISESTNGCPNMTKENCNALLQKCAAFYDQQSAQLAQDLTKTTAQKNTLQSAITKLKNKISGLEADINQGKIMVKDLNSQISDTEVSINRTSTQISESQKQMAAILQSVYEEDQKPSFVVLLEGDLSDFFSNLAYLDSLNSKVSNLLGSNRNLKTYLANQQEKMSNNVDKLQKTVALQTMQKKENEQNKQQQDQYLKLTEAQYQQQLSDKQTAEAKSAKIKAMLFQVVGVTKAPTFGEAIEIAKRVGAIVGVRPAFLLAIISQESAIGRNVGQCYLTDPVTGAGKKISTGVVMQKVMKPTRDVQPFLSITAAVGKDPYQTPVSCPIVGVVGYGGAMGPAQFIPSTWNGIAGRLQSILGRPGNPWVINDSFTASALYLADLGATAQTAAAENKAAARYYGQSGSYNRSVMNRATCIQTFIDSGTMSTGCQNMIL